ncbi:MAG: hypothetical protein O9295_07975 [Microcystis sp. LE18-22.4A]|uniref:hypothetical protein n=1 Tax=Microcystis sp. LE18-22.4A TaxID=3016432 RepID=UPI0022C188C9|nr:hypothetical protein [Microcystis sp. LE18-22.4A]MCZ8117986.1 hypothetical protein [Microcystis sp. LE18-22.4A]
MRIGKTLHPTPHTPHPTPCPHEKLFQQTLDSQQLTDNQQLSVILKLVQMYG